MLIRLLFAVLASLALGLGAPLAAQQFESVPQGKEPSAAPAPSPAGKIAVINVRLALARTQEGRKAADELQAYFAPKQAELEKLRQEITNIENQLRTQERTLSAEARLQLGRQMEHKRKEGERLQQDLNEEAEQKQTDHINRIGEKLQRLLTQYAQEKGFSVLLNYEGGSVIYAAPGVDMTDDIVRLYDQAHPVAAAGTTAPSAGSRPSNPPRP